MKRCLTYRWTQKAQSITDETFLMDVLFTELIVQSLSSLKDCVIML